MQTTPTTPTTPPIPTPAQVAAQTFAEQKISGHKVVIFSKTYCPYCTKAKNVIKKYNVNDLDIIELDNREDCELVIDYLNRLTGARSVPRVFINGNFIGGGDDTVRLDLDGKLKTLLEECGAIVNEPLLSTSS